MINTDNPRPPLPPFTQETALQKVRAAEDAWNSRDPVRVALAYTADSQWRNRDQFIIGRPAITAFLTAKWAREEDYRLVKDLWAFTANRIAVRFQFECRPSSFGSGTLQSTTAKSVSKLPACGRAASQTAAISRCCDAGTLFAARSRCRVSP